MFGHAFELPPPVQEAFTAVYRRVVPDSPFTVTAASRQSAVDAYEALYATAAEGARQTGAFAEP